MCAIQDQVVSTRAFLKYVVKDPAINSSRHRMCGNVNENIKHIFSSCKILAARENTTRHNSVAKIVHMELSVKYDCSNVRIFYCKYTPKTVQDNDTCKMYSDREILTDRSVQHNQPDICLIEKQNSRMIITDIAIPASANKEKKHMEKMEIKETWRVDRVYGKLPQQKIDGCKDQLLYRKSLIEDCEKNKR